METSSSGGFELSFNEDQKHLEEFYIDIKSKLDSTDVKIVKIEHNEWHEKYYFVRNDELAIFLFYYNIIIMNNCNCLGSRSDCEF